MKTERGMTRRKFLANGGAAVTVGFVLHPTSLLAVAPSTIESESEVEKISPTEDLMREHGVLERILLIYEDAIRRLEGGGELPAEVLSQTGGLIRSFIQNYHEKLEENYIFPLFLKKGTLPDLVKILIKQHEAGRIINDQILRISSPGGLNSPETRGSLSRSLRIFITMYRPHKGREDTVLFPALRSIVSEDEIDSLGELFESREETLFGKNGFEKIVKEVAAVEKQLGIYDLEQFTPKL